METEREEERKREASRSGSSVAAVRPIAVQWPVSSVGDANFSYCRKFFFFLSQRNSVCRGRVMVEDSELLVLSR